jgi:hypothetical protein
MFLSEDFHGPVTSTCESPSTSFLPASSSDIEEDSFAIAGDEDHAEASDLASAVECQRDTKDDLEDDIVMMPGIAK